MSNTRWATSALAAMALITGIAGCASGTSASSDPLASDNLTTIINEARVNTEAAQSVHIAERGIFAGEKESFSMTMVRGQGCSGTVDVGSGTISLVWIGKTVWVNAPPLPANKYVKVDTSNPAIKKMMTACELSSILSTVAATGDVAGTRARATINGQPAVVVTTVNPDDGKNQSVYVTDTAKPRLLRMTGQGGNALMNFTGYGATPSLTPPPPSDVVSAG